MTEPTAQHLHDASHEVAAADGVSGHALLEDWKMLVGSWILCLTLTVMNVLGAGPFGRSPQPLPLEQEQAANRSVLAVEAAWVESFRRENGGLPEALPDAGPVGSALPWSYERLGPKHFRITVKDLDKPQAAVSFDSRHAVLESLTPSALQGGVASPVGGGPESGLGSEP